MPSWGKEKEGMTPKKSLQGDENGFSRRSRIRLQIWPAAAAALTTLCRVSTSKQASEHVRLIGTTQKMLFISINDQVTLTIQCET